MNEDARIISEVREAHASHDRKANLLESVLKDTAIELAGRVESEIFPEHWDYNRRAAMLISDLHCIGVKDRIQRMLKDDKEVFLLLDIFTAYALAVTALVPPVSAKLIEREYGTSKTS